MYGSGYVLSVRQYISGHSRSSMKEFIARLLLKIARKLIKELIMSILDLLLLKAACLLGLVEDEDERERDPVDVAEQGLGGGLKDGGGLLD